MAIQLDIRGDDTNLIAALRETEQRIQETMNTIEKMGSSVEGVFDKLKNRAGMILGAYGIESFLTRMYEVRSVFQDIESTMEVFLGSQQKAAQFTKQLEDYAYYNMYEFRDLATASKQLIAYKNDVNDVIPILDKLSNIASGTQAGLMDLVSMFNTAKNAGSIGTKQLAMWASRGLVVKDVLKEMGEEVKGTTVTFDQLNRVLDHVTAEGGMFHDLMLNQMDNLSASYGQLQDDLDAMYNELGGKMQDVFKWGIDKADSLVANYEEVGKVILSLVAAYGEYRAALIATNAARNAMQNTFANNEIAEYKEQIEALRAALPSKAELGKDLQEALGKGNITDAQAEEIQKRRENIDAMLQEAVAAKVLTSAQAEEIKAHAETLDALILEAEARKTQLTGDLNTAIGSKEDAELMVTYMEEYDAKAKDNLETARQAKALADEKVASLQQELDAIKQVAYESDMHHEKEAELAEAITEAKNAALAENEAELEANSAAEQLNTAITEANAAAEQVSTIQEELNTTATALNTATEGANTTSTELNTAATAKQTLVQKAATFASGLYTAAINGITSAVEKLKLAWATNPFGIALAAITALLPWIQQALHWFGILEDEEDNTTQISEDFGKSIAEARNEVKKLQLILQNTAEDSAAHKKALVDLNNISKEYGITIDAETEKRGEMNEKIEETIRLREAETAATTYANTVDTANKTYSTSSRKNMDNFNKAISGVANKDAISPYAQTFAQDEERLKTLSDLYNRYLELKEKDGASSYTAAAALKAYRAQQTAYAREFANNAAEAINLTEEDRITTLNAMKDMLGAQRETYEAKQDDIDAAEKLQRANVRAAFGIEDFGKAADKGAWYAKVLALEADNARIILEGVKGFDGTVIKMALELDTSKIPQQFLNMTKEERAKRIEWLRTSPTAQLTMTEEQRNTELSQLLGAERLFSYDPTTGKSDSTQAPRTRKQRIAELLADNANQKAIMNKNDVGDEEYKTASDKVSKNDKELRALGYDTKGKGAKAAAKTAKENAKRHAKQVADELKHQDEMEEIRQKGEDARTEATIATIINDSARERATRKAQHDKAIRDIGKQENDIYKAIYDQRKKAYETANKDAQYENTDAGAAGWRGIKSAGIDSLTEEERKYFDARYEIVSSGLAKEKAEWDRYNTQLLADERQAMVEYLKTYGSSEQQRIAINEEYNEKIRNAKTEGERLALEKQLQQAQADLKLNQLTGGIDWKTVFGGVENMSTKMMQTLSSQLTAWQKTDEYKNADAGTKQQVAEMLSDMRKYLGSDMSVTWKTLKDSIENFDKSVEAFNKAVEDEKPFVEAYRTAKKAEDEANKKLEELTQKLAKNEATQADVDKQRDVVAQLTQETQNAANALKPYSEKTVKAKENMENLGQEVNNSTDALKNFVSTASANLNKATTWKGVEGFGDVQSAVSGFDTLKGTLDAAMPEIGDKIGGKVSSVLEKVLGQQGIGGVLGKLSSGVFAMAGIVAQIPKLILSLADAVKNMVTGILGSFSELFRFEWMSDLVVSITDATYELIDSIFDLPESLYNALSGIVVNGVGGLIDNTIGRITSVFGISGNPSDWFTNSNAEWVAETTEDLTEANEKLTDRITDLTRTLKEQAGGKAINTYLQALKAQEEVNKNQMEILWAQMRYHDAHHSNEYYADDSKIASYNSSAQAAFRAAGVDAATINGLSSIYDLTPEQLRAIKDFAPDLWKYLTEVGKYDKSEYWESVVELAGKTEELTEEINQNLTQTSFDSLRSSFLDTLMDMEADAGQWSNNFVEMMQRSLLNYAIGDKFDEQMKTWYENWATTMREQNGKLTTSQLEQYKAEWNDFLQQGIETRDQIAQLTGYSGSDSEGSASFKSASSFTQEQGDVLNGRLAAIQIAGEQRNNLIATAVAEIQRFSLMTGTGNDTLTEMRNIMISSNSHLEDIARYTKLVTSFGEKLDRLVTNTDRL